MQRRRYSDGATDARCRYSDEPPPEPAGKMELPPSSSDAGRQTEPRPAPIGKKQHPPSSSDAGRQTEPPLEPFQLSDSPPVKVEMMFGQFQVNKLLKASEYEVIIEQNKSFLKIGWK